MFRNGKLLGKFEILPSWLFCSKSKGFPCFMVFTPPPKNQRRRNAMKRTILIAALSALIVFLWSLPSHAVPKTITYQGYITDSQGVPLDGEYSITFRIYDAENGGNLLWEAAVNNIQISNGAFTINLNVNLPFDEQYWLGISIENGDELTPRIPFTSVPYSIRSGVAEDLDCSGCVSEDELNFNPVTGITTEGGLTKEENGSGSITLSISATYRLPQGCSNGQVPKWNGDSWICASDNDTIYTAGTGISITNHTINNTGDTDPSDDLTKTTNFQGDVTGTYNNLQIASGAVGTNEIEDGSISFADIGQNGCSAGQIMKWNGNAWVCASDEIGGGNFWSLAGNSITGGQFLGTTNNTAFVIKVNNIQALKIEPGSTPNIIGGYKDNSVSSGVHGATISGGGESNHINLVTDDYGTIGGGIHNQAGNGDESATNARFATVGGGYDNTASNYAATVGGGHHNTASGSHATIGGGYWSTASGNSSTVGGGYYNTASGSASAVSGGQGNTASGHYATVGGGYYNTADNYYATVGGGWGNSAAAKYATISGGGPSDPNDPDSTKNRVTDDYGTIGGGGGNVAGNGDDDTTNAMYATVAGGVGNTASGAGAFVGGGGIYYNDLYGEWAFASNIASGIASVVGGGVGNKASGNYSAVCGGDGNRASVSLSTVGGGSGNMASGEYATVGGGWSNKAKGSLSTVGGGSNNEAYGNLSTVGGGGGNMASGEYATVPGGEGNTASGDYSFAAGYRAKADHHGAFVWADYSPLAEIHSPGPNTFTVRASGIWFGYNSSPSIPREHFIETSTGAYLSVGGTWVNASDRNAKENFSPVDPEKILEKLVSIPISTWNYKAQDPSIRHIGPMAQDFYRAFGVGEDDKHISTIDADGVALSAIQGLHRTIKKQRKTIEELKRQIEIQKMEIEELKRRLSTIEAMVKTSGAISMR